MQSCLELIPADTKRVFIAYSGGLDSTVLLHLLTALPRKYRLQAWHINHGLIDEAEKMEQFCVAETARYDIEIRVDRLELSGLKRNLEAEARRQRYDLFADHCGEGDCVVTAHHTDDQAETFLLNALRGSGSAGLRGIARQRSLGHGLLLRPLLEFGRSQLEDYARQQGLIWFDDPSNRSDRFDRNFLRNRVLPLLKQRWPAVSESFATVCEIQSETQRLLEELAASDYDQARADTYHGYVRLELDVLRSLSPGRCKNLLRYWVASSGFGAMPQARMRELIRQLDARADANPEIAMSDYSIRLYDGQLYLVPRTQSPTLDGEYAFASHPEIEIEEITFSISRAEVFRLLETRDRGQSLSLYFRETGARNSDRHRLKRLFQKHRVPPWERAQIPQVYLDGELKGLLP